MIIKKFCALVTVGAMLVGCAEGPDGQYGVNKQGVGTILGGATGAVIGSQIGGGSGRVAAIAAGTLLGAAVGSGIGASLDKVDQQYYSRTTTSALESARSGQTVAWQNPDSGNYGTVTPTNTFKNDGGQYCREYTQTVTVGGKKQQAYGVACREPDGSWRVIQ